MKSKSYKYPFKDLLLVYLLIAYSTIPIFRNNFGLGLLITCIIYLHKDVLKSLRIEALIVLSVVFLLELYHVSYFPNYDIGIFRQVITSFIVAISVAYHLKINFLGIYIKIMYITTIISFFFFFGLLISPELMHIIADSMPAIFKVSSEYSQYYGEDLVRVNPIIYNFDHNFYAIRNNGPFWEPTVFASLLLIGQIFNYTLNRKFLNKVGIIFTIGIVTTFSTTVFISYLIFLLGILLFNSRMNKFSKGILFVCTIVSSLYIYYELPFLEEKINSQIAEVDNNIELSGDSRMAGATLDLFEVSQNNIHLFFGKGSDRDSRIGGIDKAVQRNCGLTGLLVEWGMFFFVIYIALIYYSFYQLSRIHGLNSLFAVPFTLCILIVSFSEIFFDLPLFHTFIFFGLVIKRYYKPKHQQPTQAVEPVKSIHAAFV